MNKFKEELNYLDKNGNIIGTVEREEGIKENLLLEAVQIWIVNPDTKQVLMQRRNYHKQNDPGMIDVSASGHVRSNEVPIQAIIREGKEELGDTAFETLIGNIKKISDFKIDFTKEGRKGKYLTHEYIAFSRLPLEKYKKQDEEVEELFFMDYEEVKKMIKNRDKEMRIPYNKNVETLLQKIDSEIYEEKQCKEMEK